MKVETEEIIEIRIKIEAEIKTEMGLIGTLAKEIMEVIIGTMEGQSSSQTRIEKDE